MAHGDAREGKWRGNWRMEWVAITLTRPRNVMYPPLLTLMCTPRLPAVDWTDSPADLNGIVRLGERRNVVSARFRTSSNTCSFQMCNRDGLCWNECRRGVARWRHLSSTTQTNWSLELVSTTGRYMCCYLLTKVPSLPWDRSINIYTFCVVPNVFSFFKIVIFSVKFPYFIDRLASMCMSRLNHFWSDCRNLWNFA